MKKLIGLLFGVLLLTACDNTERNISDANFDIPDFYAYVEIANVLYPLAKGGYSWTEKGRTVLTDHASPNQQAEGMEAILVSNGAEVKVSIEDQPDLTVFPWADKGKEKEIAVMLNSFHVAEGHGVYVYEIVATWKKGYRSYVLKVEVQ